jgi:hypothetical protein
MTKSIMDKMIEMMKSHDKNNFVRLWWNSQWRMATRRNQNPYLIKWNYEEEAGFDFDWEAELKIWLLTCLQMWHNTGIILTKEQTREIMTHGAYLTRIAKTPRKCIKGDLKVLRSVATRWRFECTSDAEIDREVTRDLLQGIMRFGEIPLEVAIKGQIDRGDGRASIPSQWRSQQLIHSPSANMS